VCPLKGAKTDKNWDRCYDFLNIFAEKFSEKIGVFVSKQRQILKKMIITLVFDKSVFSPKIGKNGGKLRS
jgi:hypothetical protein